MKLKRFVAKTMVAGGLGLPAIGLGIGVANADPPSPPPVPKPPVPAFVLATDAAAQTGLATAMADGNKVVSRTTPNFTGANVKSRSSEGVALNPHGRVSRRHRELGLPPLVRLFGPQGGLFG